MLHEGPRMQLHRDFASVDFLWVVCLKWTNTAIKQDLNLKQTNKQCKKYTKGKLGIGELWQWARTINNTRAALFYSNYLTSMQNFSVGTSV